MAQTLVNFRMDEKLKKEMEETCSELGLNLTTAFIIFAKKMTRERRIPFEVSIDPFYDQNNIAYLERITKELDSGDAVLESHELKED